MPLDGSADSQFDKTKAALKSLGRKSFAELLASHVAVHGELFRRVKLDLSSDVAERTMPAEDLWKKTHKADATPALLERVFDAGRYQIICSTGDWPPNLQGVWHGGGESAWMGDFTLNGNVPSAIAHYLNGNLPELLLSFTSYLEERIPQFRANAKNLYNCRGILVPGRSHIHGYDLHYNDDYPHQAWMAGAAWAGSFFYDYYRYTGDRDYLRDHAVPWMKETVLFFEDYLVEDKNGYFEVIPSYSPEHGGTARNTTMDVAAIRMTLRNLISACRELGIEKENIVRWQAMLAKLPPYRINAQGQLAEWIDDTMPDNLEHRHASHFLPMWHGLQPEIARDPRILAAARKAVADKAAVRCRDKKGGVMGFGTVQIGLAAASLRDAETVWRVIDNLSTLYWFPTFAAAHNCGRNGPEIFNADICGGLPAVMIDMLVQSKPGEITLLPALPDNLPRGTLEGALLRGAITVERLEWSPDSVTVELRSPKTQEVTLRTGPRAVSLTLNENRSVRRTFAR